MSKIFVSYRRGETSGHAGRLIDRLNEHFGSDRVFFDLQTLEPGVDWVEALEHALEECQVLVAVIGSGWLTAADKKGRRRLDDPEDMLRREVATALTRRVRVVPVLVQDAAMPDAADLPPDLAPLTRRQAIELTDSRWEYDTGRLIEALEKIVGPEERPLPPPRSDPGPEPPRAPAVAEVLPGTWRVQITHPMFGVATMTIQFDPTGWFRGEKLVPGAGVSAVQGQWQATPGNQLVLQGQESMGFQIVPYGVVIQFHAVSPGRLLGVSNAGEGIELQRAA